MSIEQQLFTLVRHGKSSWQTEGQTDHERPLNERGISDAPMMARRLVERGCIPDLILCSSALRTQQTAALLIDTLGLQQEQVQTFEELYLAPPSTIVLAMQAVAADCPHVMVIAHNPGLEELSASLSDQCSAAMPTLGVRHFSFVSGTDLSSALDRAKFGRTRGSSAKLSSADPHTNNKGEAGNGPEVRLLFEDYPKKSTPST